MKLSEIPYISHVPQDGRVLMFQPWYENASHSWHLYHEARPDEFIKMQIEGFVSGIYYAASPALDVDLKLPLATLVAQHLSFPSIAQKLYSLVDDLHLLSASLEKLELFSLHKTTKGAVSFLVESELEYQFTLLRAMYDVLQKMIKEVVSLLRNPDGKPVIAELPDSFASIALNGDKPKSVEELQMKYLLPESLASFYFTHSTFFLSVRTIRVAIEHHGKRLPAVFETERGFGISTKGSAAWSTLEVWRQHELLPNDIGSVRALSIFLAQSFLKALDDFNSALSKVISPNLLPPAISMGNHIYLTNPVVGHLSNLATNAASPWRVSTI
jgi:hypothetical protein